MQMIRGSGLQALDKIVRSSLKYYADTFKIDSFRQNLFGTAKWNPTFELPSLELPSLDSLRKPVEAMVKNLNNAVSQLTSKPEKVDYRALVSSFLPPGAKLLKPQFPQNSNEIQFADLDGDKRSELVASYKTNEGVKTIVLKRDEVQWYKMSEISNPDFEEIHYRESTNIAGDSKKNLLLGLTSRLQDRTLFAYSLDKDSARKIFSKKYSMIDLQNARSSASGASLALWNEQAPGIYDIELVNWNGFELEKLDNTRYLAGKVVPYYIRKLRQNPDDAAGWYNLADAMSKTGNTSNAVTAVRFGLEQNPDATLRDRFTALSSKLQ